MLNTYMNYREFRESTQQSFYHLSISNRAFEGILRSFAGSASAGAERKNFHIVDDSIDPDSAMIHLYEMGTSPEHIVLQKSNYYHEIHIDIKLLNVDSDTFRELRKSVNNMDGNSAINFSKKIKQNGYHGIEFDGLVQIYRDIDKVEIVKTVSLTPESRRELQRTGKIR